jgi:hypothetical protein
LIPSAPRSASSIVAVGRGLGHCAGAHDAVGAAAIVDDDRLPHRFGQFLRDGAGGQVCAGAGRNDTIIVIVRR